jgi:signal transduction histidine kinase
VNQPTLFKLVPWPIALIDPELKIENATDSFAANAGMALESLVGAALSEALKEAGDSVMDGALICLVPANDRASTEHLDTLSSALRSIKHEINNPLTGALGNINLLLRRNDWDEKTRKRLTTAEHEMKKIGQIVVRLADLVPPTR